MMTTGFDTESFTSSERSHLTGALSVVGTSIDFNEAEVVPGRPSSCPFVVFEKLRSTSEADVEAARNRCAIAGTSCLRGQQQLYHKAFGTQHALPDLTIFSCTINNDCAILYHHFLEKDGSYLCAPIRDFDLRKDDDFDSFQAWMKEIESWACLHLLPNIKATLAQAAKSVITPPATPPSNALSIDTNSDDVPLVMKELRQSWPLIPWRQDTGETPINSSIAQCGTPSFSRLSRLQALASPAHRIDQTAIGHPMRLQTDTNGPRAPLDIRRLSALSPLKTTELDVSPDSPCRPPSLSPADADPDMPMTARSPMLVLTRRLDIASDEIQELRGQVEHLQAKLADSDRNLEKRIARILEESSRTICREHRGPQSPQQLSLYHRQRDSKLDEGYHTNDDGSSNSNKKDDSENFESSDKHNQQSELRLRAETSPLPSIPGSYPQTPLHPGPDIEALPSPTLDISNFILDHNLSHALVITITVLAASTLNCLTRASPHFLLTNTLSAALSAASILILDRLSKSPSTRSRPSTNFIDIPVDRNSDNKDENEEYNTSEEIDDGGGDTQPDANGSDDSEGSECTTIDDG